MRDSLLKHWDITEDELTAVVDQNPSLRGMLFGYVAEVKLRQYISGDERVTGLVKDDDHDRKKKGDLRFSYSGREFVLETKSLQTNSIKVEETLNGKRLSGKAQCDASDRREVQFPDGSTITTTCLLVGEFDVLAVNVFSFFDEWRFLFASNKDLPRSKYRKYTPQQRENLLASLVPVEWPLQKNSIFTTDLFSLLDRLLHEQDVGDIGPDLLED